MSRIDRIEASISAAEASMNDRVPARDIDDRDIARALVYDATDLVTFARDVEGRHRDAGLGLECVTCGPGWPCPDRISLNRLNGMNHD